jgi:hypothetical protein
MDAGYGGVDPRILDLRMRETQAASGPGIVTKERIPGTLQTRDWTGSRVGLDAWEM